MPDALGEAKLRLAGEIDSHPALPSEPTPLMRGSSAACCRSP